MNLKPKNNILLPAVFAAALILLSLHGLSADQPRATDLGEQVRSADCIVHAKVVSSECRVEFGRIYTYYRLSSRETLKGAGSGKFLRVPGGEVGVVAYVVPGAPGLRENEEAVMFLREGRITGEEVLELDGISSAVYRVSEDNYGLPVVKPNVEAVGPFLSADGSLLPPGSPLPLDDFKRKIYKYLGKSPEEMEFAPPETKYSEKTRKRKARLVDPPVLSAGNVQAGYSRILDRPVDIFWDLSRDYGPVSNGEVHWSFNPDSIEGKSLFGVTVDQARQAAAWSFEQWNEISTSRIQYSYAGDRTDVPDHKIDLVNIVTFADSEYIYGIQKDAIASARPFVLIRRTFVGPEGLDYDLDGRIDFPDFPEGIWEIGTIIDCDIRWDVGGPYADIDFAVDQTPGALSMQGVFLHEFGHFAGLVHSPIRDMGNLLVAANRTPTMFSVALANLPGNEGNPMVSLEYDDLVSLSMLYPTPEFAASFGTIQGTVTRGVDGKPGRGIFVVALELPEGESYRHLNDAYNRAGIATGVFSDKEGRFSIPGLQPGSYVLGLQTMDDIPSGTNSNAYNTLVQRYGDVDFIWDEFYNGPRESDRETDPYDFEPVAVTAGGVTGEINIVTNAYLSGRIRLRRLFGPADQYRSVNYHLRQPRSSFSSDNEMIARRFPQVFEAPYKVTSATGDFNARSAAAGNVVAWQQIILAVTDPENSSRPDLENPVAVLEDFQGDGTLLSTDPLPFDYPITVDRPGELWLVVRSPERKLNAFHNVDRLDAGQGELQVDESFVSFDGGAVFNSVMDRNISWRMGVILEGTTENVPLVEPRLVSSEWLGEAGAIRLHFSTVKSLSGTAPAEPPVIELRHNYSAAPYPEASLLRGVTAEGGGAFAFNLTKYNGKTDSVVYRVTGLRSSGEQLGDRLTGQVEVKKSSGTATGGELDLTRVSGSGAAAFDGLWEGTFPGESRSVQIDLRTTGELVRGVLIWPAEQAAVPDTNLAFSSAPGDTTLLVDSLPANPAGFELVARDSKGRYSPYATLGLGTDLYEPNERIKDATRIFPAYSIPSVFHGLSAIRGTILATKDQDDRDYFRFPVRQGDSVVVDVDASSNRPFDPVSSLDAYIEVFDSTGVLFKGTDGQEVLSDDFTGLDPFVTFVSPRDATCYLRVLDAEVAYGGRGERTGFNAFYELRVSILPRKGDVQRDQVIRVDDVLAALEVLSEPGQADPQAFFSADMNSDGTIDFSDVGAVFRRALEEPVAVSAQLAAVSDGAGAGPVRIAFTTESPGNWMVTAETGGFFPGTLMLAFEVSGNAVEVLPGASLDEASLLSSSLSGSVLFVLVEMPGSDGVAGFTGGKIIRLRAGPQEEVKLLRAMAGIPGAGELATVVETNSLIAAAGLPRAFSLKPNVPNPFNPATTISYSVPESGQGTFTQVTLEVFNLRGALVRTLVSGPHAPGDFSVTWDGTDQRSRPLSSGVYFYRLTAPDFTSTRKMVLLK
jgi:FlgD Ig-like domain